MKTSKTMYGKMVEEQTPNSKIGLNTLKAFVAGGLICVIGQLLMDWYLYLGWDKENASLFVSATLIAVAALLTGIGIYDRFAKHAGAGSLVPITGFSNAVASPAVEFKAEGMVLGLGAKLFIIAGPVIVYGVTASVIYGVIYYFVR